jgi:hypothetical protein
VGLGVWLPDLCWYAEMSDHDQLRNRAARLLTMALKARKEGHLDYAERFTQRASEILEQPTALERLGTQSGEKATEPPEPNADRSRSHPRPILRAGRARSQNRKSG